MNHHNTDKLSIQMLGNFCMTYHGNTIILNKGIREKMLHLLYLLLCSRETGVSREVILRELYGTDSSDPQACNSMRALVFRLRQALRESGLPEDEYIITRQKEGRIFWEPKLLEVELDVDVFQNAVAAALDTIDANLRISRLMDACHLYSGDFLPDLLSVPWVARLNYQYRELYFRAFRELAAQMQLQNRYEELLSECEQVLECYPSEEWQNLKMDCLIGLKQYRDAILYHDALKTEYRDLMHSALPNSPVLPHSLEEKYLTAKNLLQNEPASVSQIVADLTAEAAAESVRFYPYLTFCSVCGHIVQLLSKAGFSPKLLLLTLASPEDALPAPYVLEHARSSLELAIQKSVPASDFYTRRGSQQFLVLLTEPHVFGKSGIEQKICEQYRKMEPGSPFQVRCEGREF